MSKWASALTLLQLLTTSHLVVCPPDFLKAYQCSSAVMPQAKHSFPKGTSSHIQSTESGDSGLAPDSRPCISDDHKSSTAAAQWTKNPMSTSNLFSSWMFLLIPSKDERNRMAPNTVYRMEEKTSALAPWNTSLEWRFFSHSYSWKNIMCVPMAFCGLCTEV